MLAFKFDVALDLSLFVIPGIILYAVFTGQGIDEDFYEALPFVLMGIAILKLCFKLRMRYLLRKGKSNNVAPPTPQSSLQSEESDQPVKLTKCPQCGSSISGDTVYCENCGCLIDQ